MHIKAIRIAQTGGPEVLTLEQIDLAAPGPGQIRVRHKACGVNFIDIYHRTGLYPLALPAGIGMEAAGVIEELGPGVTQWKKGDRIAYASGPLGAYSQAANVAADRVVGLPDNIGDDIAASILLKGMTAEYLLRRTYRVKPGDTILFHAAAGGVGQLACQWAKALGATVIGTVGSRAKVDTAKSHGCDHVIVSREENIAARLREITGGKGVPVVYDSVGRDTFMASLDCLQPLGLLVSFGNASGPVAPFDPGLLAQKGSLYFTRPTLATYVATPDLLQASADALFGAIAKGAIRVSPPRQFPLSAAADAHMALQSRETTGALVLKP
jgi:NADPH2:quinone reductase